LLKSGSEDHVRFSPATTRRFRRQEGMGVFIAIKTKSKTLAIREQEKNG